MSDKSDPRNVCSIRESRLSPIVLAKLSMFRVVVKVTKLAWATDDFQTWIILQLHIKQYSKLQRIPYLAK